MILSQYHIFDTINIYSVDGIIEEGRGQCNCHLFLKFTPEYDQRHYQRKDIYFCRSLLRWRNFAMPSTVYGSYLSTMEWTTIVSCYNSRCPFQLIIATYFLYFYIAIQCESSMELTLVIYFRGIALLLLQYMNLTLVGLSYCNAHSHCSYSSIKTVNSGQQRGSRKSSEMQH